MSRQALRHDGTADCDVCGLAAFPRQIVDGELLLECANRHQVNVGLPADPSARAAADNWLAKRGAQLHAQHERWGTDDRIGRDERDI